MELLGPRSLSTLPSQVPNQHQLILIYYIQYCETLSILYHPLYSPTLHIFVIPTNSVFTEELCSAVKSGCWQSCQLMRLFVLYHRHPIHFKAGIPSPHHMLARPVPLLHGSQFPRQTALGGSVGVCRGW